jgi:hypothetical protein
MEGLSLAKGRGLDFHRISNGDVRCLSEPGIKIQRDNSAFHRKGEGAVAEPSKIRGTIKFLFWTAVACALVVVAVRSHISGQMAAWYYHTASEDGYAINAHTFKDATKSKPAVLEIGQFQRIEGLQAVPMKKGERLPANANGIISADVLKRGRRATLQGNQISVTVPFQIQEKSGFKFKDGFTHKGIRTNPWAALWNIVMVTGLGLSLGFMAEGFTDVLGIKLEKIRHFEAH